MSGHDTTREGRVSFATIAPRLHAAYVAEQAHRMRRLYYDRWHPRGACWRIRGDPLARQYTELWIAQMDRDYLEEEASR